MSTPQDPDRPSSGSHPLAEHLAGSPESPELSELRARVQERLPDYSILGCLGRGGMGAVFRAHHLRLDRPVAIKVLLPAPESVSGWEERFLREAQALARLTHPGIVSVFDFGQASDLCWIVMEYVDGASLRDLIADGRMRPEEALSIVPQICDALQYAHDRGVVHRDIKPENVLLDERGRVCIADFGLAKLMDASATYQLTGTAQAMGTLRYMAPEQLERPREVDHRADIFSLGVVFYEMLTGQVPAGAVQPPSERGCTDPRLDEPVMRSMEREPEGRYQSASEMVDTLQDLSGEAPSHGASAVSTAQAAAPQGDVRRKLRIVSLVMTGLALLALGLDDGSWPGMWSPVITEEPGMLLAPLLIVQATLLWILGNRRRGLTSAFYQLAMAPLVIFATQVLLGTDQEPSWNLLTGGGTHVWALAQMSIAFMSGVLAVVQILLREPGEPHPGEYLKPVSAGVRWLVGLRLAHVAPAVLAVFALVTNMGWHFGKSAGEGDFFRLATSLTIALIASIGGRGESRLARISLGVQIAASLFAALVAGANTQSWSAGEVGQFFMILGLLSAGLALLRLFKVPGGGQS